MLPCSRTTAFDTDPFTSIDNSITAPDPVVVLIVTVGLNLYPLPASETNTDLIFPSSIVGTSVAVFTVPTPTNCKSFSVSTVTSYKPVAVKGAGSDLIKLDKSTSSTIRLVINTFRGVEYISLRKYYLDFDEEWLPSKEGITMPIDIDNVRELFVGLVEVLSLAESKTILEEEFKEILDKIYLN